MTRILKDLNFKKPGIYIIALIVVLVIGGLYAMRGKKPETVTVKRKQPTENNLSDREQQIMQITEPEYGQIGFISDFLESDGKQVVFDCAELVTDENEPKGFRIENQEKEELTYMVDQNTEYGIIDRAGGAVLVKVDKNTFMERVEEYESLNTLNTQPFIIEEQNGIIQVIYERYVP